MSLLCKKKKALFFLILVAVVIILGKYLLFYFRRELSTELDVQSWLDSKFEACSGQFIGYGNEFAVLKNVAIIPSRHSFCVPNTCGTTKISSYRFIHGKEGTHLNNWLGDIKHCDDKMLMTQEAEAKHQLAVVVMRYEYLNFYHTMTDWYNVYLVTKLLNFSISSIAVILLDQHPSGYFDKVWETLFSKVIYWNISTPLQYPTMVWSILGYESPLNYHRIPAVPYVDDFSQFFLEQHKIFNTKVLDCNNIQVLFSFRRDYYFSPGTPIRVLTRKIDNENELLKFLTNKYKSFNVTGVQLDKLEFTEQLRLIAETDVIISMHGAGLSHILFLPKHAGVIELFPLYWTKYQTPHFKAFSRWRGVKYLVYQNWNSANEKDDYKTYIPPYSLDFNVQNILTEMCSSDSV